MDLSEEGVSLEPKRKERSEGIQMPEFGSVRAGREAAKEKEIVNGSRRQSLDLSEEGVSQEPKRRKSKRI